MTAPDHGVDLLLRRATDDLHPDVDHLVAGGISRGRTRQRRARIGTAVAAVAVFGVIGAAAAVVPQLGSGPDSARDPVQPATSTSITPSLAPELTIDDVFPSGSDPANGTTKEQELWMYDTDSAPDQSELRPLVAPEQMERTLSELTGGVLTLSDTARDPEYDDQGRRFQLLVDGALVTFFIHQYNPAFRMLEGADPLGPGNLCRMNFPALEDCAQQPDGSWLLRQDTFSTGGVGVPKSHVQRVIGLATVDGWQIDAAAYNTSEEKTGEQVAEDPVLTMAELETLVLSARWYR